MVARRQGLDGLAHTNHDYYAPFDLGDLVTVPGIEVSSTAGHILVIGPNPPTVTAPGERAPETVVEMTHARDCAAVLAHPYRNSTIRDLDRPFDALEVNGKHPRSRAWVERLAREQDLPIVGGSDLPARGGPRVHARRHGPTDASGGR
jgi:predicted metal-dependent phosphoesterase TrpH